MKQPVKVEPPPIPQPPKDELVVMVNKAGEEVRVKPMHVSAWQYMGYSVKEK